MTTAIKKCRMMLTNHTLSALSVSASPSPMTGYEAANLQDPDRTKICKVAATAATFTFRMDGPVWAHALFMTGLACSVTAQFRLRANSADADWGNADYDTGWQDAYPSAYPMGAGLLGEYGFGGYITTAVAPYHRPIRAFYFGNLWADEYWKLELSDPDGDGTVGLGVAAIGPILQMNRNFKTGWKLIPVDTTVMRRSTAAQPKSGRPGTRYDQTELVFMGVPDEDMFPIHNALKTAGRATPYFLAMHPESTSGKEPWTTLYGTTLDYSGFEVFGPGLNNFKLRFAETP